MGAPHVTITVTGASATSGSVDKDTLIKSLYMTYMQSVDGDRRHQWIVFPPAVEALGVDAQKVSGSAGRIKVLHRTQEFEGNRSKWFHQDRDSAFLLEAIETCRKGGQKVSGPVLVQLELDDYLSVWEGSTPHKAIRAVDREIIAVLKTTIKGKDD
jgi:hypothetical protein